MARVNSHDLISSRTSPAEDGVQSSLNDARVHRMLRELGCSSYPFHDSYVTRGFDRSSRTLGLSRPADHGKASEELEAQVDVERRLRAEATRLTEALEAWEKAVAKTHIEIDYRVQPENPAREEAGAVLEIERRAPEEAGRRAEATIDTADRIHAEAINRTLAEMMARVQAEQQVITEKRVRAAAEDCANCETVELVSPKHGVFYKVFFHSRYRLPHRFHPR